VYTDAVGTVYGPYNEGAYFKVYKLQKVNTLADSAKVRHILIGTMDPKTNQPKRSMAAAKKTADSLITLIKEKKVTFDTLVKTVSDDLGSVEKGGDYGWFTEDIGFVEPFKNAGLMGVKGNISPVETQFGIHIIEVLDVSKTSHQSYRLAQIFKPIVPSEETTKNIFNEAKQFAGENNTADAFDKAIDAKKLSKRIADNVKEADYTIPGMENARELVRWAFGAKKGEVNLFSFNDKHLVAKVSAIKEKGFLPLEEVRDEVVIGATEKKKAEYIINEFNSKASGASSVEDIATKLGVQVVKQENLNPESHNIMGIGVDNVVIGTAAGIKQGVISKPIVGEMGVFVIKVNAAEVAPAPKDYKMQKMQLEQMIAYRADGDAYNALKQKANIENYIGRFE
jgi:peptidyl-prolyl cis-trans isomerase D